MTKKYLFQRMHALQSKFGARLRQTAGASRARHVQPRAIAAQSALEVKHSLLSTIAGLDRGAIANPVQRAEIERHVQLLEGSQAVIAEQQTVQDMLAGRWQLIYTSVETFRSSPFFWAFQEGLVGNREVAAAIFKFTDSIPGAQVGQAFQTFDWDIGQLVSEVDLEVFPGAQGCLVTTSRVRTSVPPTQLQCTVESTRVARSNMLPWLIDPISVPVKDIIDAIRGAGSTTVTADVTFIDTDLRVTRTRPDDQIFIYRRA